MSCLSLDSKLLSFCISWSSPLHTLICAYGVDRDNQTFPGIDSEMKDYGVMALNSTQLSRVLLCGAGMVIISVLLGLSCDSYHWKARYRGGIYCTQV